MLGCIISLFWTILAKKVELSASQKMPRLSLVIKILCQSVQSSHTASLSVEIDSATISYESLVDRPDSEETHYLLVTKKWKLDCLASENSLTAKVS